MPLMPYSIHQITILLQTKKSENRGNIQKSIIFSLITPAYLVTFCVVDRRKVSSIYRIDFGFVVHAVVVVETGCEFYLRNTSRN